MNTKKGSAIFLNIFKEDEKHTFHEKNEEQLYIYKEDAVWFWLTGEFHYIQSQKKMRKK